jgi:hypothetical protein
MIFEKIAKFNYFEEISCLIAKNYENAEEMKNLPGE